MANITAADVNKLRKQTGSGMMDCKKALTEADGDFDKAVEILRKKGQKVAAKRGDREAAEGYVVAQVTEDKKQGVILILNCETDFVAKNDDFVSFAQQIANTALNNGASNVDELMGMSLNGNGMTVGESITEQIGKIGEKLEVSDYALISAEEVVGYNHPGNKTASLIGLNKEGEAVASVGKDLAMQIAAMAPVAIDKEDVPSDVVEKEIEIGKEQALAEGKPEAIVEKIAMGKLNKFYQENTLLNQEFIKESKKSVRQYMKETDPDLTVTAFKRISIQ
jgi:elongation factor Ts